MAKKMFNTVIRKVYQNIRYNNVRNPLIVRPKTYICGLFRLNPKVKHD